MTDREISELELATILCEWDQTPGMCHCTKLSADDRERCKSPLLIARILLKRFDMKLRDHGEGSKER